MILGNYCGGNVCGYDFILFYFIFYFFSGKRTQGFMFAKQAH
jgi:hypothetical protein